MRQAAVRQVSQVTTSSAPVKGLNAFDSIVSMPPGFALVLRNFYAQPYGCQVRRGYRKHCVDGILGYVESLCAHNNVAAPSIYAFADDAGVATMYDVTTPNVAAVPKLTGLKNARWQHMNFSNAAGNHLLAVNGADNMVWVQPNGNVTTISSGTGTNQISGVDPKALINIYSHQKRIWFVEKNSTRGWYLPPDQLYGEAKSFDFGPLWTRGGYLTQIITWTIDDGEGADDHLAAISSEGQVAVYKGMDVEGADSWGLQGVYFAGAPVGRRAAARYGGDIVILTEFGIVFMADLLKSTKVNPAENNDARYVQQLVSAAIGLTRDKFGWQPFIFPAANMFIINVPATEVASYQFVMNDITKAWSEFLGYNAYCWELFEQLPFFGGFQGVYRAWEGTSDGEKLEVINEAPVITKGDDVRAEAQTTFDYFGSLGQQKHFKMIRPTLLSRGQFSLALSVNTDFVFNSPTAPAAFSPFKPGVWDEDLWDNAIWEGGLLTYKNWQGVVGIGTAAAIRLLIRSGSETYWASTDWVYENGGIL